MSDLQPRMKRGRTGIEGNNTQVGANEFFIDTTRIQLISIITFMNTLNFKFNGRSFCYYDGYGKKRYLSFNNAQQIHNNLVMYVDYNGIIKPQGNFSGRCNLSGYESYKLVRKSKLQYIKSLKGFRAQSKQVEFL